MCKNFMLTNVSKLTVNEFVKMRDLVSKVITGGRDDDGFGYAAIGENGEIFGERMLDTKNIKFQLAPNVKPKLHDPQPKYSQPRDMPAAFLSMVYEDASIPSLAFNHFGNFSKPRGAFLAHARLSTNEISIGNTHPHRTNDFTLIHNGMVENIGADIKRESTCDTEYLVRHLTDKGLEGMVNSVTGYYAIGAIEHATGNLLIMRDDKAPLSCAWCPDMQTMAIATCPAQLTEILKGLKWRHSKVRLMVQCTYWIFDVNGGLIASSEFVPAVKKVAEVKSWSPSSYAPTNYPPREINRHFYDDEDIKFYDLNYDITTRLGAKISYTAFVKLSYDEQEMCEVTEKYSGRKVAI